MFRIISFVVLIIISLIETYVVASNLNDSLQVFFSRPPPVSSRSNVQDALFLWVKRP